MKQNNLTPMFVKKKRLTTQVYKRITFCALQTLKNKTNQKKKRARWKPNNIDATQSTDTTANTPIIQSHSHPFSPSPGFPFPTTHFYKKKNPQSTH